MIEKIKSRVRLYSYIIFPLILTFACCAIRMYSGVFSLENGKIQTLVSISATFIGVLLTIATLYLTMPKNESIRKRFRESYHEDIYLKNIITGIILFVISIISWLFFDKPQLASISFISGLSNIGISIYYTFTLIKSL